MSSSSRAADHAPAPARIADHGRDIEIGPLPVRLKKNLRTTLTVDNQWLSSAEIPLNVIRVNDAKVEVATRTSVGHYLLAVGSRAEKVKQPSGFLCRSRFLLEQRGLYHDGDGRSRIHI